MRRGAVDTGGRNSLWVNQEVGAAKAMRKLIVPVVEKGVSLAGFPAADLEYLELDREDPYPALGQLSTYLGRLKIKREQDAMTMVGAVVLLAVVALALSEK